MTWFDDIMDDPIGMTEHHGLPLMTYEQINIFASLLLLYLVNRRGLPREIALIIVGVWAATRSRTFHLQRRRFREYRDNDRYYGPGW